MSAPRERLLAALALVAAVLMLTACGGVAQQAAPPLVVASSDPSVPAAAGATTAAPVSDYRVSIGKIDASSTLVPLGLNADKTVQVPPLSQPQQAGLYTNGPAPGDPGPAVVLGHINSDGRPGVFARLSDLTAGDEVDVARPDGRTAVFQVYRTATVDKSAFPTAAVYSDTPGPELRLITCGGDLNRAAHSYLSNVIVFAALSRFR